MQKPPKKNDSNGNPVAMLLATVIARLDVLESRYGKLTAAWVDGLPEQDDRPNDPPIHSANFPGDSAEEGFRFLTVGGARFGPFDATQQKRFWQILWIARERGIGPVSRFAVGLKVSGSKHWRPAKVFASTSARAGYQALSRYEPGEGYRLIHPTEVAEKKLPQQTPPAMCDE